MSTPTAKCDASYSPPESIPVDKAFKLAAQYDLFCPEGSVEQWCVIMCSRDEHMQPDKWASLQVLQANNWDVEFEWVVFMKTGNYNGGGFRHFSKKLGDGSLALKTFADWYNEKTGNTWAGSPSESLRTFSPQPNKFEMMRYEDGFDLLTGRALKRERTRNTSDIPVDLYFKDKDLYQVYVAPNGDPWAAVMGVKDNGRHTLYAVLQVLIAKPDSEVEFDFVVFMRHGKLGGSAQRYAKRYTLEVAALATFQQWFKDKTKHDWLGSSVKTLETFSAHPGKHCLLERSEWNEVFDFEDRSRLNLIDSDVAVDKYYRDKDCYRIYHTETGELWAAVLANKSKSSHGSNNEFVLLQMLVKKPELSVDFDFVVLRRVGRAGESGLWTAKKFTNELDALRNFRMWYFDETGNQWQGAFHKSYASFQEVPEKMSLLPRSEWDQVTSDNPIVTQSQKQRALESFLSSAALGDPVSDPSQTQNTVNPNSVIAIDVLRKAMALEERKTWDTASDPQSAVDIRIPSLSDTTNNIELRSDSFGARDDSQLNSAIEEPGTPLSTAVSRQKGATSLEKATPPKEMPKLSRRLKGYSQSLSNTSVPKISDVTEFYKDRVDPEFALRKVYTDLVWSTALLQADPAGRPRVYVMQLLTASRNAEVAPDKTICFHVRLGRVSSAGASNHKFYKSLELGKKAFRKKFLEKTKNEWLHDREMTLAEFVPVEGQFHF